MENIDELETEATRATADIIAELRARAEQKDTIRKEVLKFFSEIGFDMFSKEETDKVFEWLNNNQSVMESL